MILSSRHEGKIAIVQVQGKLTLGPTLRRIKPRIDELLASKPTTGLVMSLAGVSAMDSAGLGELVTIHSSAARRGVRMVLANVSPSIQQLLAITRLDGILPAYAGEAAAIEGLAAA